MKNMDLYEKVLGELKSLANPEAVVGMARFGINFDSWDVCDQCCSNLFDKTKFAYQKAVEWSKRDKEFVKRAGFVLMAVLAVHDKKAKDEEFLKFLPKSSKWIASDAIRELTGGTIQKRLTKINR